MEKGVAAPRRPSPTRSLLLALAAACLAGRCALFAADAGSLPLRPGEAFPQPAQRSLDEIESVPERDLACPACSFEVRVPEVATLMRGGGEWRLHAASRDADLCPHPGPGKIAYRADIVVCPSCGYASPRSDFPRRLTPLTVDWVHAVLRPNIRAAQTALLGQRGGDMSEEEVVAFFNRQSEIPDVVRTEHLRILLLGLPVDNRERAEAAWEAAFAIRRELASPPKGRRLSGRIAAVRAAMERIKPRESGINGEIEILNRLTGTIRSERERLPLAADRIVVGLLLAGRENRLGLSQDAEARLDGLLQQSRERYARPEQDPLWRTIPARLPREERMHELENFRGEIEREVVLRLELIRLERTNLTAAADLVRDALMENEFAGQANQALFHGYLIGEFLRRLDNLPLASEWFRHIRDLAPLDSPLRQAASLQLEMTHQQAGNRVNLLSAVGQDGQYLAKLREIVNEAD